MQLGAQPEGVMGSIRRHIVFGERHLRHALLSYMNYYDVAHSFIVEQGPNRL